MSKKGKNSYIWRLTNSEDEGIVIAFGPELSEAPYSDEQKLDVLGRALVKVGMGLMGATTGDDDE